MGKIMITGALGNVGGYVAKYAIEKGEEVIVADIDKEALIQKYKDQAEAVYFDFTNHETYPEAIQGIDRVFIMRPPHLGRPEDIKPFIEKLQTLQDIKMVCFLSLIGIEKNPIPPHYKIEKYIKESGLPYCFIRPSFFMQNISGVHAFEIKHFNQIIVPVKKALTSFIDAQDIGELTATILCHPDKYQNMAFSITGPEAIHYDEVAQILSEELNRKIIYANPNPRFTKKYWIKIRQLDKEYVTVMGMLYMMTRLGTAKSVTNTFEEMMNKKPQTFRQFVQRNKEVWL